ncbi:MAG: hypothetical protein LBG80_00235 [Bacteroidales bacterium]|jgi:DNA-binding NtrC family response regulator|nr:hypothetical protein [Bacteroidales bacterium]
MDTEIINNENFIIEKIKSIPQKYYIIGGIAVLILIVMYVAYRFGKNERKKVNTKNNILPKSQEKQENRIAEQQKIIEYDDAELPDENDIFQEFIDKKISATDAAEVLRISKKTFYRRIKKFKDARNIEVDE